MLRKQEVGLLNLVLGRAASRGGGLLEPAGAALVDRGLRAAEVHADVPASHRAIQNSTFAPRAYALDGLQDREENHRVPQ